MIEGMTRVWVHRMGDKTCANSLEGLEATLWSCGSVQMEYDGTIMHGFKERLIDVAVQYLPSIRLEWLVFSSRLEG